jgi:hypothetical protein
MREYAVPCVRAMRAVRVCQNEPVRVRAGPTSSFDLTLVNVDGSGSVLMPHSVLWTALPRAAARREHQRSKTSPLCLHLFNSAGGAGLADRAAHVTGEARSCPAPSQVLWVQSTFW